MTAPLLLHASCVCVKDKGILLIGASGTGKSDLALRLIDRGAVLVADDYVNLSRKDDVLMASPPDRLAGKIEVRGVGICTLPFMAAAQIHLYVDLAATPDRFPDPAFKDIAGVMIPRIAISALEASAPQKIELALSQGIEHL